MKTGRLADHIFIWFHLGSSLLWFWHFQLPQRVLWSRPWSPLILKFCPPTQPRPKSYYIRECFLQSSHNGMSCPSRRSLHQWQVDQDDLWSFPVFPFFFHYLREQCVVKRIFAFKTELTSLFTLLANLSFLICTTGIIIPTLQGCGRIKSHGLSEAQSTE